MFYRAERTGTNVINQYMNISLHYTIYKMTRLQGLYSPTILNPLPSMPILGSYNSAANKSMMSKIWTMGIQLSVRVENIVGKEEIARYEQFLLFAQCFQKLSVVDALK